MSRVFTPVTTPLPDVLQPDKSADGEEEAREAQRRDAKRTQESAEKEAARRAEDVDDPNDIDRLLEAGAKALRRWKSSSVDARVVVYEGDGPDESDGEQSRVDKRYEARVLLDVTVSDYASDSEGTLREIAAQLGKLAGAQNGFSLEDLVRIARGDAPDVTSEQMAAAMFLLSKGPDGKPIFSRVAEDGRYYPLGRDQRRLKLFKLFRLLLSLNARGSGRGLGKAELMRAGLASEQVAQVQRLYGTDGELLFEDFYFSVLDGFLTLDDDDDDGRDPRARRRPMLIPTKLLKMAVRRQKSQNAAQEVDQLFSKDIGADEQAVSETLFLSKLEDPERDAQLFALLRNEDGEVELEDLVAAIEDGLVRINKKGRLVPTRVGRAVMQLMKKADSDDDGLVTSKELARATGMSEAFAKEVIRLFGVPDDPDTLCPSELAAVFEAGVMALPDAEENAGEVDGFKVDPFALLLAQAEISVDEGPQTMVSLRTLERHFTPAALALIGSTSGVQGADALSAQSLEALFRSGAFVIGDDGVWDLAR